MKNIEIQVKCTRQPLEAICETLEISKAIKGTICLEFPNFIISVSKDSNPVDLYEIYKLNEKLTSKQ